MSRLISLFPSSRVPLQKNSNPSAVLIQPFLHSSGDCTTSGADSFIPPVREDRRPQPQSRKLSLLLTGSFCRQPFVRLFCILRLPSSSFPVSFLAACFLSRVRLLGAEPQPFFLPCRGCNSHCHTRKLCGFSGIVFTFSGEPNHHRPPSPWW